MPSDVLGLSEGIFYSIQGFIEVGDKKGLEGLKIVHSDQKTLRQILLERFLRIDKQLDGIKRAIEIMAKNVIVSDREIEQLKYQVAAISESLDTLEQRVVLLERSAGAFALVIRHGITIVLVVIVVLLLNYWVFGA